MSNVDHLKSFPMTNTMFKICSLFSSYYIMSTYSINTEESYVLVNVNVNMYKLCAQNINYVLNQGIRNLPLAKADKQKLQKILIFIFIFIFLIVISAFTSLHQIAHLSNHWCQFSGTERIKNL